MREYILTEKETELLEAYVEHGIKLDGFTVLVSRCRKAKGQLDRDIKLIESALIALNKERKS